MRILVPVDGTEHSLHAVDFLLQQTDLIGQKPEIEIFFAQTPVPSRIYAHESPEELARYYDREAARIFDKVIPRLSESLYKTVYRYSIGDAAEEIVAEAHRTRADLIVMGARRQSALRGLLFGSVSNRVIADTHRPVLMLREQFPVDPHGLRVGLAVDGSDYSLPAVDYVIKHRAMFGSKAEFTLINAVPDFSSITMPSRAGVPLETMSQDEVRQVQEKAFEEAVTPSLKHFLNAGIECKTACVYGNPGDAISKYADEQNLDLIVMGTHGYGNFQAAVLGSCASRIAAVSRRPLLIISKS